MTRFTRNQSFFLLHRQSLFFSLLIKSSERSEMLQASLLYYFFYSVAVMFVFVISNALSYAHSSLFINHKFIEIPTGCLCTIVQIVFQLNLTNLMPLFSFHFDFSQYNRVSLNFECFLSVSYNSLRLRRIRRSEIRLLFD